MYTPLCSSFCFITTSLQFHHHHPSHPPPTIPLSYVIGTGHSRTHEWLSASHNSKAWSQPSFTNDHGNILKLLRHSVSQNSINTTLFLTITESVLGILFHYHLFVPGAFLHRHFDNSLLLNVWKFFTFSLYHRIWKQQKTWCFEEIILITESCKQCVFPENRLLKHMYTCQTHYLHWWISHANHVICVHVNALNNELFHTILIAWSPEFGTFIKCKLQLLQKK